MPNATTTPYRWRFFRAGGFNQVIISSGADLLNLDQLDQKLWVALACPTTGVEFDHTTLALIDTDKDGRIRVPELIAAAKWAGGLMKNPDDLLNGSPTLRPSAINDATPEGKLIANFARQVLGKSDAGEVTFEEAAAAAQNFAAKSFNGDGIIPADSAGDDPTKAVIADIITCLGADTDASGKPGVSQVKVDQFFSDAAAYSDWWKKAEGDATVLPLGVNTEAASGAVKAVKAKVDDYFARGRLAAFDPRSINALNRDEKEYAALAAKDLTNTHVDIAGLPLAQVGATTPLPLAQGINPAWANAIAALQTNAIVPLLGARTVLTEADWNALVGKLAAFDAWNASKTGGSVEKIGLKRAREILATRARETLSALIAKDKNEEGNSVAVIGLHRLIHYHRDLARLCRNFVSFSDFYGRKDKAIFQAGTLYLDQRSCDLCLIVDDAGKHAAMAGMAGTYLAYCDCVRKGSDEKLSMVAAFTGGDSDNLMVGRNGIFYDRKGRDWDATITKIIENPISIRQAFWSPYKKLVRMIEERAAKEAAAADASANAQLTTVANAPLVPASPAAPAAPAAPAKPAFDPSVIALLSLALGTLAAAFAGLLGFLKGFEPWQVPLVVAGIMLVISAPSMAIAWLKLRKRNLGPILDANGWAVNARAKMNVPFGGALTGVAALPPGATFSAADKYAEKPSVWPKLLLVAFVLWFIWAFLNDSQGRLYRWTDGKYGKPSMEVQKLLDLQKAQSKTDQKANTGQMSVTTSTTAVTAPPAVSTATNAVPAK
ncbi:MAG TPA: phage holin family protein [Candidatus Acidoferrales bacterium]|nr:phage holin family protein [Candidatus Acidoferrales bacterium]